MAATSHAGEMSVAGSASLNVEHTNGGAANSGKTFSMGNQLTFSGSGELDNGTTVSYKQTVGDSFGFNDSELVFGNVLGMADVALTSTGSPISAIDDVTPTAFEEANALLGSIDDVNGMDGTYGIRVTMADFMGTGFKIDGMYSTDVGSGDAQADNGTSGETGGTSDKGIELTVTGSVPMVEGLDVGVGYYDQDTDATVTTGNYGQQEGTAYIKYSTGPVSVGYQRGVVEIQGATSNQMYDNEMIGISYKVTDDFSVSYNELESRSSSDGTDIDQKFDSISVSYSMGGMTINLADSDVSNSVLHKRKIQLTLHLFH